MNLHTHPIVEQLLRDVAPRAAAPLRPRERISESAVGAGLLVAVGVLAAATGVPAPAPLQLIVAILAYIAARRVEFRVGAGTTSPAQPVLVVMLLVLPPWVVPLAIIAAALVDRIPAYVTGKVHPDHSVLTIGDAWHALALDVVLAAAGRPATDLDLWPL